MSLTTLADIKTANNITGTTDDAWITLVQPGVEQALQTLIGYPIQIATGSHTEYYNGNDSDTLLLNQVPVPSVVNIWLDTPGGFDGQGPTSFTGDPLVAGTDYYLQLDGLNAAYSATGTVKRINGNVWPGSFFTPYNRLSPKQIPGMSNIKVQYVAGYATVPADIQMAVWESIGAVRAQRRFGFAGPIQSESLTASAYSLGDYMKMIYQLGSVRQIVSMYRRLPI